MYCSMVWFTGHIPTQGPSTQTKCKCLWNTPSHRSGLSLVHSLVMTEYIPNCITSGNLERSITNQSKPHFPGLAPVHCLLLHLIFLGLGSKLTYLIFAMVRGTRFLRALRMLKGQRTSGGVWWPARTIDGRDGTFSPVDWGLGVKTYKNHHHQQ